MILFSPAKINIGLLITRRRDDGYHDLQSVMHPVGLYDLIEIMETEDSDRGITFTDSGIPSGASRENNLCMRACELYGNMNPLPPLRLHLHKQIPVGAGLGGGSSDASATLKGINMLARKPLPEHKLEELAASVGSDCPFFLRAGTMMTEGRGERLTPVSLRLEHLYLVLLNPGIHVSTAAAYREIRPAAPEAHLGTLIREPIEKWRNLIVNDFEVPLFKRHPLLKELKQGLYQAGALYASMSGSGSSVYGFFRKPPSLPDALDHFSIWKGGAGCALTPA